MAMTDPPPEDEFFDIVASLNIPEPTDVTDYSQMGTVELSSTLNTVTQKLYERGEMRNPHTPEARDLHSQRNAITLELRKRGML